MHVLRVLLVLRAATPAVPASALAVLIRFLYGHCFRTCWQKRFDGPKGLLAQIFQDNYNTGGMTSVGDVYVGDLGLGPGVNTIPIAYNNPMFLLLMIISGPAR